MLGRKADLREGWWTDLGEAEGVHRDFWWHQPFLSP